MSRFLRLPDLAGYLALACAAVVFVGVCGDAVAALEPAATQARP